MFAVLKTGGKQYKVKAGDMLRVEKIAANTGETVQFNEILMNYLIFIINLMPRHEINFLYRLPGLVYTCPPYSIQDLVCLNIIATLVQIISA